MRSATKRANANPLLPCSAALEELVSARHSARDVRSDPWDFAVEIGDLMALGLGRSGLRWLVRKGYAEHACEVTRPGDASRRFRREPSLAFTSRTCFVLTDAGHSWLGTASPAPALMRLHEEPAAAPVPHWDGRMRTLYLGDRIVKRYRVLAGNQEAVLSAFEEGAWMHVIDDPLPHSAIGSSREMQLRNTIRRLNANQVNHLLHFHGDGSGFRVGWEAVQETVLPLEAARHKARRAA
jgi:hypothetical protein